MLTGHFSGHERLLFCWQLQRKITAATIIGSPEKLVGDYKNTTPEDSRSSSGSNKIVGEKWRKEKMNKSEINRRQKQFAIYISSNPPRIYHRKVEFIVPLYVYQKFEYYVGQQMLNQIFQSPVIIHIRFISYTEYYFPNAILYTDYLYRYF